MKKYYIKTTIDFAVKRSRQVKYSTCANTKLYEHAGTQGKVRFSKHNALPDNMNRMSEFRLLGLP